MNAPYKQELKEYLDKLFGENKVEGLERIPEAITTVAYKVSLADGQEVIAKVAIDEKDIEEGKRQKEMKAIETAKYVLSSIVEVPNVISFEETIEGFPGYIVVMRKSQGVTMSPDWLNKTGTSAENLQTIVRALSALHSVTSENVSDLATFEAEKGSLYVDKYLQKAHTKLKDFDIFKQIEPTLNYLGENISIFDKPKYPFIHRDVKHNNLLVGGDKISAIIDWETALFVPLSMEFAHVRVLAPIYGYEKWMEAVIEAYNSENPAALDMEELELAEVFVAARFFMRSYEHSLSKGLETKIASGEKTENEHYMEYLTKWS